MKCEMSVTIFQYASVNLKQIVVLMFRFLDCQECTNNTYSLYQRSFHSLLNSFHLPIQHFKQKDKVKIIVVSSLNNLSFTTVKFSYGIRVLQPIQIKHHSIA